MKLMFLTQFSRSLLDIDSQNLSQCLLVCAIPEQLGKWLHWVCLWRTSDPFSMQTFNLKIMFTIATSKDSDESVLL